MLLSTCKDFVSMQTVDNMTSDYFSINSANHYDKLICSIDWDTTRLNVSSDYMCNIPATSLAPNQMSVSNVAVWIIVLKLHFRQIAMQFLVLHVFRDPSECRLNCVLCRTHLLPFSSRQSFSQAACLV